ncbi:MAG: anaerobic ribonucleoside-triphosphate reductase activating protein [Holosporales bacterium]|jgi:pyruvate formate lyase activating enzyme|nr:anaerobic ribonucleoside-triphosphate reductase activating protein [Holosporales bacterium]
MKIGGFLKFSILDYPGKLSCVVFCQGCSLRCVYCHNPEFLPYEKDNCVDFQGFLSFLQSHSGSLDAVVFSGGEPLLQDDLFQVIELVKGFGFLVGIHTSGIVTEMFERIVSLVDWIGFDVKTVFSKYDTITKMSNSGMIAKKSLELLLNSGTSYEIRTTYDSRFISNDDIFEIAKILQKLGVKEWVIQKCIIRETGEELTLLDKEVVDGLSEFTAIKLRGL